MFCHEGLYTLSKLKHLPLKASTIEQRFVEFVAKTEATFGKLSPVSSSEIRNLFCLCGSWESCKTISAQDSKLSVIVSGVLESGSTDTDLAVVKNFLAFWVKTV